MPVCVEVQENSELLTTFVHPENAVYVFGSEHGGVPQVLRQHCHRFVHIQAHHCLSIAAAIDVVLAHRRISRQLAGVSRSCHCARYCTRFAARSMRR